MIKATDRYIVLCDWHCELRLLNCLNNSIVSKHSNELFQLSPREEYYTDGKEAVTTTSIPT